MKNIFKISLILIFLTNSYVLFSASDIKEILKKINHIEVTEIQTENGFSNCFKIMVKQLINHADSTQGYFLQKVYLSHKSLERPMTININGYISFSNKISDWAKNLNTNHIYVEHRYFGESKPDTLDYEFLNIENAVKDLHRIKNIFGDIYKSSWISTGTSKGGLTALSYRYFYPDDVDVTISHSTSVKTSKCDVSFYNYIDSLNLMQGCSEQLDAFQRNLLLHQDEILPHLEEHFKIYNKKYSRLGLKAIYEIAVLELPFSIWQNRDGCKSVDYSVSNSQDLFNELKSGVNNWFLTDDVFDQIDPYHYQALTELGHYCFPTIRFNRLLKSDYAILTPVQPVLKTESIYSNNLMVQIKVWAETKGNRIIYISGSNDPYSKYRISPNANLDAKSIILLNKNHNQTTCNYLDATTLSVIKNLIFKWTEKPTIMR